MKIISRLPFSAIVLALAAVKAASAIADEDATKSASQVLLDSVLSAREGQVEKVDTTTKKSLPTKRALQNSQNSTDTSCSDGEIDLKLVVEVGNTTTIWGLFTFIYEVIDTDI